jgi:hypothetical protein
MAAANSNTTSQANEIPDIQSESIADKAHIKLDQVNGILDCLYTLACKDKDAGTELGLAKGTLASSLDLAMHQVNEVQSLLEGVES